jgi:hypothetical protein
MRHLLRLAAILCLALTGPANLADALWLPSSIKEGNGQGGFITHDARKQAISAPGGVRPYGLVQMDTGRIAMVVSAGAGTSEHPAITFSDNGGDTWSAFQSLPTASAGSESRPLMLTYLGGGNLSYVSNQNISGASHCSSYFSSDYGQTWGQPVALPPAATGYTFMMEGNTGVDRDANGNATRVMEIGYPANELAGWPNAAFTAGFRSSTDGGRTFGPETQPANWKYTSTYNGVGYTRGVSEGSVVRAANGDLVAALRTDMPARFYKNGGPYDDSLEGTAVSISHDNGATWSNLNLLFEAGRHHANLQLLPDGDLLMTLIVRDDIRTGDNLTTSMRGCDALLSHDNGATWNLDQRITLDEFSYLNPSDWVEPQCGHLGTTLLSDGSVLTAYGNYLDGTVVLTKWNPTDCPEPGTLVLAAIAAGLFGLKAVRRGRR